MTFPSVDFIFAVFVRVYSLKLPSSTNNVLCMTIMTTMCDGVLKNEEIQYKLTSCAYTTKTITATQNETTRLTILSISRTINSEKFSLDKFLRPTSHDFDRPFVRWVVERQRQRELHCDTCIFIVSLSKRRYEDRYPGGGSRNSFFKKQTKYLYNK